MNAVRAAWAVAVLRLAASFADWVVVARPTRLRHLDKFAYGLWPLLALILLALGLYAAFVGARGRRLPLAFATTAWAGLTALDALLGRQASLGDPGLELACRAVVNLLVATGATAIGLAGTFGRVRPESG